MAYQLAGFEVQENEYLVLPSFAPHPPVNTLTQALKDELAAVEKKQRALTKNPGEIFDSTTYSGVTMAIP